MGRLSNLRMIAPTVALKENAEDLVRLVGTPHDEITWLFEGGV